MNKIEIRKAFIVEYKKVISRIDEIIQEAVKEKQYTYGFHLMP